jgi:hypothetical protein
MSQHFLMRHRGVTSEVTGVVERERKGKNVLIFSGMLVNTVDRLIILV